MYAMTGKFTVRAEDRQQLVGILLEAARLVGQLPECRQYLIAEDAADESAVWVFEVWNDKESHDASLRNDKVKLLIAEAMPLLISAPSGTELKIMGGHGI